MYATYLHCLACGRSHPLADLYLCPACGGILDARYAYQRLAAETRPETLFDQRGRGMWKYRPLLPLGDGLSPTSLEEGGTCLRLCVRLGARWGLEQLFIKDETTNPSGSFKDRPISVGVSKALELGARGVLAATTGNAGASLAAYAARAGLPCLILIPARTPVEKVAQARAHGAMVIAVRGTYSHAFALAGAAASHLGWANLTTTFINPYTVEGDKTITYEVYEQLGGQVPDWVVAPVGAGPLLVGVLKGCQELQWLGLISHLPRLVGVQATGCAPLVRAFEEGAEEVEPWGEPTTLASGISDPLQGYAQDGTRTLGAIRDSGGVAVAVSDGAILAAVRELARTEGVFAEPAGAAPIAAVQSLVEMGRISRTDSVVCLITGHGLKDPGAAVESSELAVVEPELAALEDTLHGTDYPPGRER